MIILAYLGLDTQSAALHMVKPEQVRDLRGSSDGKVVGASIGRRQEALTHAWRWPGSGAPRGNKNAVKHGLYTREAIVQRRHLSELSKLSRKLLSEIE
jgi:hypothetical protein